MYYYYLVVLIIRILTSRLFISLPLQVAAYDFILPVFVNGREPIPPPPSHFPPSHSSPQVAVGTKRQYSNIISP